MANIFGKTMTKREILKCVGDISQIGGLRTYTLRQGKADGVKAVDVKTGIFDFSVLPDRGMDIAWASYKGIPVSYAATPGICAPVYFEPQENGFLRNFSGGLLTTCGLTYMGHPCIDEGEALGLHGRISNIPAEQVSAYAQWEDDEYVMYLRGMMRECRALMENVTLTREITTKLGSHNFKIKDIVVNDGFTSQPLMLLYHFNFGFPLLGQTSRLIAPPSERTCLGELSEHDLDEYDIFGAAAKNYAEKVIYLDMTPDENGIVTVCLYNEQLGEKGIGVYLRYRKAQLKYFTEWKQLSEGGYVVGLEPGTWKPEGRATARTRGELEFIEAGETRIFEIEVGGMEIGRGYKGMDICSPSLL